MNLAGLHRYRTGTESVTIMPAPGGGSGEAGRAGGA
jgi:hypothetical protein